MKINEFNQPKKIDEVSNLAGKMFGDVPMSALKGMFTGKGGKQQLAQDIFLRDFYQDAITSLDNGIKSGYVDKNKPYGTPSNTQSGTATDPNANFGNATPQNVGPASGAAGASGSAGTNVATTNTTNALNAPTLAQRGTNVTTKAGTTGTTGSITTGGPSAPATSTTAPKPGAPATPATAARSGSPTAPGTPPAGKTPTATPAPATNQQNQQYKWAPKGMKITPNTPLSSLGATGKLAESTYHNLNNIFESVISEMEGGGDATVSITDHMLEWFGQYMDGANWESKKAAVIPQIKKIQDTYKSDGGKAAIKSLARFAYSITGQRGGGGMPAGAKNAVQNTTGVQPGNNLTPEQLAAALASLPKEEQEKVILQVQRLNVK